MEIDTISILYPQLENISYKTLSQATCHDLGLDYLCQQLTSNTAEQKLILSVLSKVTANKAVSKFREEVFSDILHFPNMRKKIMELLNQVRFMKEYGSIRKSIGSTDGIWELLHRLDDINEYIKSIEAIKACLEMENLQSQGLLQLKEYIDHIYDEACFAMMKEDILKLKADTSNLKSITLGVNVDERFEAESIGLISVNNKAFKNSAFVKHFDEAMLKKECARLENDWNGKMRYHANKHSDGPMFPVVGSTLVNIPKKDGIEDITRLVDHTVNQMLNLMVRRLREALTKYASVSICNLVSLLPELTYYIRFAEKIETLMNQGMQFCQATLLCDSASLMKAKGIYNLRLALSNDILYKDIITNQLEFDSEHLTYILTGANRGGKTTFTQAIGILYALAQGGIYVPGSQFEFVPVDCIYTHFAADEDQTMDLGRLGEECQRFREIFHSCTEDSLLLMNETFSTTSFEEGYFIARDAVKAILAKGIRTIYNTHMHKLAYDIDEINLASKAATAASLIVRADGGNRSFLVAVAPPEGNSHAKDIAQKYGVTYEMLVCECHCQSDENSR